MNNSPKLFLGLFLVALASFTVALKEGDCEVCIKTVEKFGNTLDEATKKDPKKIETEFRSFCKSQKSSSKENRFVSSENFTDDVLKISFECADNKHLGATSCSICYFYSWSNNLSLKFQCYYLGGLEESATGILGEVSKPLSWSMPADKICEKLKKKDNQICDLKFGKGLVTVHYRAQPTNTIPLCR